MPFIIPLPDGIYARDNSFQRDRRVLGYRASKSGYVRIQGAGAHQLA